MQVLTCVYIFYDYKNSINFLLSGLVGAFNVPVLSHVPKTRSGGAAFGFGTFSYGHCVELGF